MDFSRSWPLDLDPASARRLALDEAGRVSGFAREGSRDAAVTVEHDLGGGAGRVRVVREIVTGADGAAAALLGRFLPVEQTELWQPVDADGGVTALLHIVFPGRPIVVSARVELRPTASGCDHTISGRATVRLPAVGRLVERRIVDAMLTALDVQWSPTPAG